MKKLRNISLIAATSALALAAAGCAGEADPSSTDDGGGAGGTVAFAALSLQVPIVTQLGDAIEEYFTAAGYEYTVQDASFDATTQAQQLQQAIDNRSIVAAWIFPVSAEGIASTLAYAQDAEIPVVIEAAPSDVGYDGAQSGIIFNSPDFTGFGEAIAEQTAACIAEKGVEDAQVLFLDTVDTSAGSGTVKAAIMETIEQAAPDAEIVAEAQAGDITTAQEQVQQLLIANPDATVVIAGTDETSLGAVNAYKAAGKQVDCIVGGGGNDDALAAQESGEIDAVVAWDYSASVDNIGGDLLQLMEDPTAEGGVYELPFTVHD